jgi:hypothetical protein
MEPIHLFRQKVEALLHATGRLVPGDKTPFRAYHKIKKSHPGGPGCAEFGPLVGIFPRQPGYWIRLVKKELHSRSLHFVKLRIRNRRRCRLHVAE